MFSSPREKFDLSNLHDVIAALPNQLAKAWDFTTAKFPEPVKKIFIFGMGGSALPGDLVKNILDNGTETINFSITVVRDYKLPREFTADCGGIFISYSGNTEETVTCVNEALEKNFKNMIIMASGGKLLEMANEKRIPSVTIPTDCLQPRMGYGYFVSALLKVFYLNNLIADQTADITDVTEKLNTQISELETRAEKLAETLKHSTPLVYTFDCWKYIAMVIKINFNENSKTESFWNVFPELNHNEMVGFTHAVGKYKILIFNDPDANPHLLKRTEVFTKLLKDKLEIENFTMPTGSALYKAFHTLLFGLWTSYHLALIKGIDPTPVDLVEQFKKDIQ